MRKKEFFTKLDSELQSAAPPLSDDLKSMPITVSSESPIIEEERGGKKSFSFSDFFSVKKLAYFATAFVILFVSIFGVVSLSNNIKRGSVSDKVIVKLDINPSLEFLLNEEMKVEKIISLNADGDVLLTAENLQNEVIGKPLKEAVNLIASKATELGFIDYNKNGQDGKYNKISLTAVGNKEKLPENLLSEAENYIVECFKQKGIYLFVQSGEEANANFNELLTTVNNSASLYMNGLQESASSLEEYYKELVFDYCTDSLIFSLNKYHLISEIYNLNEAIKEAQSFLPANYWAYNGSNEEILALVSKMQEKLNTLCQIYGIDMTERVVDNAINNELRLVTSYQMYSTVNIEGLENLALTGITEALFSEGNLLLIDFLAISAESILSDVIQLYNDIVSGSEQITQNRLTEMLTRLDDIKEKRVEVPALSVISDSEYEAFLQLIGANN